MKKLLVIHAVVIALLASAMMSAQAQLVTITSATSSGTIKFDDQNSFLGANNGALYQQNSAPWNGSTFALTQIDPTTGDSANASLQAIGGFGSYNVILSSVALTQPVGNTGYADLIFSFSVDYLIGANWNGASTISPSFLVSGTVQNISGSFASITGQINYFAVNSAGTISQVDQVNYNWVYNTPGTFSGQSVAGTAVNGTLGNIVGGTTMTMAGTLVFRVDPATFTVTTVPEPSTLALFGLGAAGLFVIRRKVRKI